MYELEYLRRFLALTAMCAVMVMGFVGAGHNVAAGPSDGHVAIMQSGSAGHQQVAAFFDNGTTQQLAICPTTGYESYFAASTTGNFDGMFMATTQRDNGRAMASGTIYNGTMALMRERGFTEINSGGFGHRLSAARMQGHVKYSTMAAGHTKEFLRLGT